MARQRPSSCPRLLFRIDKTKDLWHIEASARVAAPGRPLVGEVSAYRGDTDQATDYQVAMAKVAPNLRGCGVGTQLYLVLAQAVCALGGRLVSDQSRTDAAEMFWRKQRRKGRAVCVTPHGGVRIEYKREDFEFPEGARGRWPCGYYALTCPVTSLMGARR